MGGIFNIIVGLLLVAGGLSGRFALIGTNSGGLLAAVGAGLAAFGVYRFIKDRRRE